MANYGYMTITKNANKVSPLLAKALSPREEISCTLSFYRASSFGIQETFLNLDQVSPCQ
ncbi:type VI secretion system tube protein Hcp [Pseudomonas extremaustralis]|uniref:type VI secretion system tube protein Hcp n=1 Tax=Pseudomonas extremaustralis TaxID=359110 RepID=UPI0023DFDDA5|nr:type VI secretion system tube protein Hcp [Pseudomonas extremaustralis]MDF3134095.1 type VI secretion system tube protein Hcp [Pseudomonas extremaustralis]